MSHVGARSYPSIREQIQLVERLGPRVFDHYMSGNGALSLDLSSEVYFAASAYGSNATDHLGNNAFYAGAACALNAFTTPDTIDSAYYLREHRAKIYGYGPLPQDPDEPLDEQVLRETGNLLRERPDVVSPFWGKDEVDNDSAKALAHGVTSLTVDQFPEVGLLVTRLQDTFAGTVSDPGNLQPDIAQVEIAEMARLGVGHGLTMFAYAHQLAPSRIAAAGVPDASDIVWTM